MSEEERGEIAGAIVEAADHLVKGFHEFVFHERVGNFLGSFSGIADGLDRIATSLEGIAVALEDVDRAAGKDNLSGIETHLHNIDQSLRSLVDK